MVRNPYAQVEGKMRRYNTSAEEAAKLSIQYLKYQKEIMRKIMIIGAGGIGSYLASFLDRIGLPLGHSIEISGSSHLIPCSYSG